MQQLTILILLLLVCRLQAIESVSSVAAQQSSGLIAVQPWAQLAGTGKVGIGWMTSQPADGKVQWTQSAAGAAEVWHDVWYMEDGIRQVNCLEHRAIIEGFDPTLPLRYRVVSRAIVAYQEKSVTFGATATSAERVIPAQAHGDGALSFVIFNDIHNNVDMYQPLLNMAQAPLDFVVLNGDLMHAGPQSAAGIADNLLAPMAFFAANGLPTIFLRGNHETRGPEACRLKRYLTMPENRYYGALTYGVTRIVMLDCGENRQDADCFDMVDFDTYLEQQNQWLAQEIQTPEFNAATWKVVIIHIPPEWNNFKANFQNGNPLTPYEKIIPLLDAGKVDAVVGGHHHTKRFSPPGPRPDLGFHWPVFVSGGHPLSATSYLRVDADATTLSIKIIDNNGTIHTAWGDAKVPLCVDVTNAVTSGAIDLDTRITAVGLAAMGDFDGRWFDINWSAEEDVDTRRVAHTLLLIK